MSRGTVRGTEPAAATPRVPTPWSARRRPGTVLPTAWPGRPGRSCGRPEVRRCPSRRSPAQQLRPEHRRRPADLAGCPEVSRRRAAGRLQRQGPWRSAGAPRSRRWPARGPTGHRVHARAQRRVRPDTVPVAGARGHRHRMAAAPRTRTGRAGASAETLLQAQPAVFDQHVVSVVAPNSWAADGVQHRRDGRPVAEIADPRERPRTARRAAGLPAARGCQHPVIAGPEADQGRAGPGCRRRPARAATRRSGPGPG